MYMMYVQIIGAHALYIQSVKIQNNAAPVPTSYPPRFRLPTPPPSYTTMPPVSVRVLKFPAKKWAGKSSVFIYQTRS